MTRNALASVSAARPGWRRLNRRALGAGVLLALATWMGCGVQRLEPGWAAVRIHYDRGGERESIPTGGYVTYNPVTERIARYPVAQQSLVMVRRQGEPDNSVACLDRAGVTINLDSTTFWRVDPEHVADLYDLRPDVPLTSNDLNQGIGNVVVRRLVRGVMHDVCGEMGYQEIFGSRRAAYVEEAYGRIKPRLAQVYILVDDFQLGSVFLEADQQRAFSQQAQAQQDALTAQAGAEKARREADTAIAQAEGRKQVAMKDAEAAAARVELDADAQAKAARARAAAEADTIRLHQTALAESPEYRAFELGLEQARHQPSTYIGSGGPVSPQVAVQTPPRSE